MNQQQKPSAGDYAVNELGVTIGTLTTQLAVANGNLQVQLQVNQELAAENDRLRQDILKLVGESPSDGEAVPADGEATPVAGPEPIEPIADQPTANPEAQDA